jgi:hypothetical protein
LKNWMISRQGPQWKVMRGTSVLVISLEQRGQSGFIEYFESCGGDTTPGDTVMYATGMPTEFTELSGPGLPAAWPDPGGRRQ